MTSMNSSNFDYANRYMSQDGYACYGAIACCAAYFVGIKLSDRCIRQLPPFAHINAGRRCASRVFSCALLLAGVVTNILSFELDRDPNFEFPSTNSLIGAAAGCVAAVIGGVFESIAGEV